jgi:hypothetical protein
MFTQTDNSEGVCVKLMEPFRDAKKMDDVENGKKEFVALKSLLSIIE